MTTLPKLLLAPLLAVWGTVWPLLAAASGGTAPGIFVALSYDVDPTLRGCPTEAEFQNIVGQQLGYDPFRAKAVERIRATAVGNERGIEGSIEWIDSTGKRMGERRFTSRNRDCNELMQNMGFALAVQLQLLARDGQLEPAAAPPSTPAEAGASTAANRWETVPVTVPTRPDVRLEARPPVETATDATRPNRWSAMAGLGPAAGLGLGPDAVVQGRLFVAIGYAMTSLEIGGEASLPSTARQPDGSGFTQNLMVATIAACGHQRPVSACALGKFGQIRVRGSGVDVPASPSGTTAQAGLRVAVSLELGHLLLLVPHTDALFMLTPWTVELNQTPVWTTPRLSGLVGIDLATRFR